MGRVAGAATGFLAVVLLAQAGCRSMPEFPGAPPDVVEDCRRQVVMMTERDPGPPGTGPLVRESEEQRGTVIDDARAARADEEARNLASWPEEVLLYRCLAARGVDLDPEQARELAEWEAGLDPD
ncbi:MAG TPA: hypothetical protein VKZ85_09890 [Woeseiaceae bacterium]|nr:hypothetical protein [Woeseiaceae bacterium]